jgi:hypothetical protein
MSQRLIINLVNGTGVASGVKKAVFNADDIFYASAVPDGFTDDKINLYTSEGKYFILTCASTSVTDSVVVAINNALISNPGGRLVEAQVGQNVLTVSDLIS